MRFIDLKRINPDKPKLSLALLINLACYYIRFPITRILIPPTHNVIHKMKNKIK